MNFDLDKSIELLERTPEVYATLFSNSIHNWDKVSEEETTWNAYNIIGHLIHGEKTDWIPRAEIILGNGTNKTFEPYDRFAQERLYSSQTTKELLDEFQLLRKKNIETLKSWDLTERDLDKKGTHPDLGEVTLRQMISTWTVHDVIHLNQVSRAIITHYAEDVGPWKKYIRLLQD